MKRLGVNEIRELYLSFFESKDHLRLNSASLVPQNDKSLLLINSGMAPLKPYFKGIEKPPRKRVTTCQKCIRTGDIDNIGKTDRHGTFFEMLGNFSFGDYFKEEAISYSWEFLTKVLEIPEEKLYATVYLEDDEAYSIWENKVGLPKEKIFRLGKEDNFWEHGVGPCGPSSEIFYDRGEKYGCGKEGCTVGCDCDRYIEIWNNVFTQFDAKEDGTYEELIQKNIDTGMGLERLATVLQEESSIFDVDTIKALREEVCKMANVTYGVDKKIDVSIRIITDHIRSTVFMVSDGILFSNEGRGYVLRRLLRRAARHGMILGLTGTFLNDLAVMVIESSKGAYKELEEKRGFILKAISAESEKFNLTIKSGTEILEKTLEELKEADSKILSGSIAFKLYDTYGFPLELTKEMAEDNGFTINEDEFKEEMNQQKVRAREARSETSYMGRTLEVYDELDDSIVTKFVGYEKLETSAKVIALVSNDLVTDVASEGEVTVFLDETTFYAKSGGQHGDKGIIESESCKIEILDTTKVAGTKVAHIGRIIEGQIKVGDTVTSKVCKTTRMETARNHTATHLLQKALRTVLGSHVEQSGSDVSDKRLRFDFTHFEAITADELKEVEKVVNESILSGLKVDVKEMSIADARELGAMALFGEKYGDVVRVVNASGYSIELCGGTHVSNTAEIGLFKIVAEQGVASGVRRIEAVTGTNAIAYFNNQEAILNNIAKSLKCNKDKVEAKVSELQNEVKNCEREISKLKSQMVSGELDEILDSKIEENGLTIIAKDFKNKTVDELMEISDKIKDKLGECIVLLGTENGESANLVVVVTDGFIKDGYKAGDLIKEMVIEIDGKGGGRPNMAKAGGKNCTNISKAIDKGIKMLLNK